MRERVSEREIMGILGGRDQDEQAKFLTAGLFLTYKMSASLDFSLKELNPAGDTFIADSVTGARFTTFHFQYSF